MPRLLRNIGWAAVAFVGAACAGVVALRRGESVNAIWIVVAAACIFVTGYRFYGRYIGDRVLQLDASRATPAQVRNDGLDFVPTDKNVLFGHHFAAIAGAGPLVGPVLAAQLGYVPGTLWILIGVLFAGAVQDFVILFLSMRRDGRSLGEMIREELGTPAGLIAMVGILAIMIILLAVLALVVVKALAVSPWGTFTVFATMPIAVLMGLYLRYVRPGKILEISVVGFVLLLLAIWLGGRVAESAAFAPMFTFEARSLAWILIAYGFVASVLPVWLLLAPRDYLSTFLKIGTIALLAIAILVVHPQLRMPPVTRFIDGSGPVWSGSLFPFLFITIACGSVSGFHALISSGTTPKMIRTESDARFIGYGAMLMEAFVAVMALIAACVLDPGVYFALNAPPGIVGTTVTQAAQTISSWGFVVTPDVLTQTAKDIGETTILARAGGAPTLAVGMAQILHRLAPSGDTAAFWYHYAILFEALFILTTVDAGTRVGRFMIHELLGYAVPSLRKTESWGANLIATGLCVAAWGYFLYQGVVDPLGGINTLWPLFGISNQMLAGIALTFASVVLVKMKRTRFAWVTIVPMTWLLLCTLTAGWEKAFSANVKIGFLAHAHKFSDAIAAGTVMAPAKSMDDMRRVVQNDYVDAGLCLLFMAVALSTLAFGALAVWKARSDKSPTAKESPYQAAKVGAA
jgi:carbon starvation protein